MFEDMAYLTIKTSSLLMLILMATWTSDATIGFKKSLKMDARFPPPFRKDAGLPEGHLRPLGWHTLPDDPVYELQGFPDIRVFYHGYSQQRTPVVLRQALNDTEVFKNWESDKFLKDSFGKINLTVITQRPIFHKDEMKRTTQVMKFKKFLHDYEYEDWYLTTGIPKELQAHLQLPSILSCGVISRYLQKPELWMSSGSTASKLHSHHDHNLHCVLFGRRDYVVIQNRYRYNFEFKETYPHSGEGYSNIDMEKVNMFKHKSVKDTPWTWATLLQGDCILIPSGFLHYVQAYGRSISYNVLFSPTSDLDEDVDEPPCKKVKGEQMKMSEASFTWTYEGGKTFLTNRNLDDTSMRHHLLSVLGDDGELYFERFQYFYNRSMSTVKEFPPAQEVFDIMKENIVNPEKRVDKDHKGLNYVTRVDIHRLEEGQLTRIADIFNDPKKAMAMREHAKPSREEL